MATFLICFLHSWTRIIGIASISWSCGYNVPWDFLYLLGIRIGWCTCFHQWFLRSRSLDKFADWLRIRLIFDKVELFLLWFERVTMLTAVLSVWVVSLNTSVIRAEFWSTRTCKALLTTIKYLTWKLLSFRIKVESFFPDWDFRIILIIWFIIRVGWRW